MFAERVLMSVLDRCARLRPARIRLLGQVLRKERESNGKEDESSDRKT